MEYTNKNEIHQFEAHSNDVSKVDLINHLRNIQTSNTTPEPSTEQPVKPKSALAQQMEGLSFEEQKEMLNRMAASGSTPRVQEYVGKRYSLEDLKKLDVGLTESVKILINEAATAPRMDLKSITVMVDDFHRSKLDTTEAKPMVKKQSSKKLTAA